MENLKRIWLDWEILNQNTSVISLNMEVFRVNSSLSRAFSEHEWGFLDFFFGGGGGGGGVKGECEKKQSLKVQMRRGCSWGC